MVTLNRIYTRTGDAGRTRLASGAPVLNEYGSVVGVVNNTQSIYYDSDHGQPENFQMTVRNCTPAQMLLKMIKPL